VALRQTLGRFATGVAVMTTRGTDGKLEGVTSNSFSSVSLDPPLVLWSLGRRAGSFETFATASHFAVNILASNQMDLSRHFAARQSDKLASVAHHIGIGGCPLLGGALAHIECSAERTVDGGDHIIFIGRILNATHAEGEPLMFSAGQYCRPVPLDPKGQP
jgi:flavin reductase (DIM6/NTAB) family NADH-FMN oxidoreductase RutF